jgi:hypothetical protein
MAHLEFLFCKHLSKNIMKYFLLQYDMDLLKMFLSSPYICFKIQLIIYFVPTLL